MSEKLTVIDWLSVTYTPGIEGGMQDRMTYFNSDVRHDIKPKFGYHYASEDNCKSVIMWGSDSDRMGTHLYHSGSALKCLMDRGVSPFEMVTHYHNTGGKITRLDVAFDIMDPEFTITELHKSLTSGTYNGTIRKWSHIHSADNGETLYLGARSSEKFVRVYNKAAETGARGLTWIRVEVELKDRFARAAAQFLAQEGVVSFERMIIAQMNAMFTPDVPGYNAIMNAPADALGVPKVEERDTRGWLLTVVPQAVARMAVEAGNDKILEELIRECRLKILEETKKQK